MSSTATEDNSGPGYAKHPEHKVKLEPTAQRVRIVLNGETVADTTRAMAMLEGDYPACYYIPCADVRGDLIAPTATSTYCPFKGSASYWSFEVNGKTVEDAAWSYETPYDEVMDIMGYFSFYPKRVDELIVENAD